MLINRKLLWAEIWLLTALAEYYNMKILYTPIIPYLTDYMANKHGVYLSYMKPMKLNFKENHIPYLKEDRVNDKIIFDPEGSKIAQTYAERKKWVRFTNMSEVYFDLYIGSATLDIYQPKASGVILTVDTTQGYHQKSIHLATRYPKIKDTKSNILKLFPENVWLAFGASMTTLTMAILVTIFVYSLISLSLLRANLGISQVLIRLFAGFTEPDNENWFKTFSTGSKNVVQHSKVSI